MVSCGLSAPTHRSPHPSLLNEGPTHKQSGLILRRDLLTLLVELQPVSWSIWALPEPAWYKATMQLEGLWGTHQAQRGFL